MAASSSRGVRSLFSKCGSYTWGLFIYPRISRQFARKICVSSRLDQKNQTAARPQKFSEEYIQQQVEEFGIGKRHLANMMGEDPETFTQEDIDRSIAYLFPSGLFEKRARPIMKHPDLIFPKQTAVQWGEDGRPFHFLFYTGKAAFYSLMHETFGKVLEMQNHEDTMRRKGTFTQDTKQIAPRKYNRSSGTRVMTALTLLIQLGSSLGGSRWLLKEELEDLLIETISDHDYARFLQLMERLLTMPYCSLEEEFVHRYRKQLEIQSKKQEIPELHHDEKGVAFSQAQGRRKTATASVTLRDCGSGSITINGKDCLQHFPVLQDREQILFPLHFVGMLDRFDVQANVEGGGRSAQAGAVRLAISRALLSFMPTGEVETMRQAGLLTADPRIRERKKPGQAGAREKFTWKKR